MTLELQIQTLISSFVCGLFYSLTYNILYRFLYSKNKGVKFLSNILYTSIHVLIYFMLLMAINNCYFHIYFVMMLIIGFIIGNNTTKKIRTKPVDKKDKKM